MSEPSSTPVEAIEAEDVTAATTETTATAELVEQDLIVEDVSIDGMCGVY